MSSQELVSEINRRFKAPEGEELQKLFKDILKPSPQYQQKSIGRFPTANDANRYQVAVRDVQKKSKRMKTYKERDLLFSSYDQYAYAVRLFKDLIEGLMAQNLHTHRMVFQQYEFILPAAHHNPEHLEIFEMIHRCAPTVSIDQLISIIPMEQSTISSPPTTDGAQHIYVRSFPFTASELYQMIDHLISRDMWFEELGAWRDMLDTFAQENDAAPAHFVIRYVGVVEGPKRPIDRHVEDITQVKNGILAEFHLALQEILPHVESQAQVHSLTHGTIPVDSFLSIEDHERMMIQFLDPKTLLNRQRGGYYASYVPSLSDAQNFRDLNTDFWSRFCAKAGLPAFDMKSKLTYHWQSVQSYANDNPYETGTGKVKSFSDSFKKVVKRQSTPFTYHGATVLVFVGKDITLEEYLDEGFFMNGKSRAGYLTRDFLHRLVRSEALEHDHDWDEGSFDTEMGPWCFVDLWSWPWHKNPAKAIELLQDYMDIAKPLISAVYSGPVNNITRANFQHGNGIQSGSFTSVVGIATIQYYAYNDDGTPDVSTAFINIPHLHPGKDKYGKQDTRLRRVMDLCLQYTFVIGDVSLTYLDELAVKHGSTDHWPDRFTMCEEILRRVRQLGEDSAPHREFNRSLQQARNDLMDFWATKISSQGQTFAQFFDERPRLNAEGYRKIKDLGQAEGTPSSNERRNQLEMIWNRNLPDLHILHGRTDAEKARWMASLTKVPQGQYFYLSLQYQKPPDAYSTSLFTRFATALARSTGSGWISDPAQRARALKDANDYVSNEIAKLEGSGDIQPLPTRTSSPYAWLPPAESHGRRVQIRAQGTFAIKFVHEDGRYITIDSLCKPAIPKESGLRYMYFTEKGINIVGAQGELFSAVKFGGAQAEVSIALPHIQSNSDFLEFWRLGCVAQGIDTSAMDSLEEEFPPRVWGPKGVAPLNSVADKVNPVQNFPPKELDGNWLLDTFINSQEHLRDGGFFRTASTSKFPDSTEDLQNFVKFLSLPEYRSHPWQPWWMKCLSGENPSLPAVLAKNLPMLRNSVQDRRQENSKAEENRTETKIGSKVSSRGKHVNERFYILGGPDSRVDDPFDPAENQSCLPEKIREENKKKANAAKKSAGGSGSAQKPAKAKPKKPKSTAMEDVEAAADLDDIEEEPKPSKKKKAGKRKRTSELEDLEELEPEEVVEAPPKKVKKSKKKKTEDDEETAAPARRTMADDFPNFFAPREPPEARPKSKLKRKNALRPDEWEAMDQNE